MSSRIPARRQNAAAYMAVIQPGDGILGLDLAHGGHLTHGHKLSFSGKLYRVASYKVRPDTETIDYDELESIAVTEQPKLLIGGGSAYPRQFDFPRMRQIADKVGGEAADRYGALCRPGRPVARTLRPFHTRTLSPQPRTKPCAVPGRG